MASFSNCGYAAIISSLPADFGAPSWTTYSLRSLTHTNGAEWGNSRSGAPAVDCCPTEMTSTLPTAPDTTELLTARCTRCRVIKVQSDQAEAAMPPTVKLIELCDLANRALTNGSGNTATILDSSRSGAAYWPRGQPRWTCLDPRSLLKSGRPAVRPAPDHQFCSVIRSLRPLRGAKVAALTK
jgi:hypothetical protein